MPRAAVPWSELHRSQDGVWTCPHCNQVRGTGRDNYYKYHAHRQCVAAAAGAASSSSGSSSHDGSADLAADDGAVAAVGDVPGAPDDASMDQGLAEFEEQLVLMGLQPQQQALALQLAEARLQQQLQAQLELLQRQEHGTGSSSDDESATSSRSSGASTAASDDDSGSDTSSTDDEDFDHGYDQDPGQADMEDPLEDPFGGMSRRAAAYKDAQLSPLFANAAVCVIQAIWMLIAWKYTYNVTDTAFDALVHMLHTLFLPAGNLLPPSYHLFKAVLGIKDLSCYQWHACPAEKCCWPPPPNGRKGWAQHHHDMCACRLPRFKRGKRGMEPCKVSTYPRSWCP